MISAFAPTRFAIAALLLIATIASAPAQGITQASQRWGNSVDQQQAEQETDAAAESELQTAIQLTRRAQFQEAIAHFRTVQGRVRDEFAADFNLALCYVATGQHKEAIRILTSLHPNGKQTAPVFNLLAQAYFGNRESAKAFESLKKAAALDLRNEKLYLFVADSCMDQKLYDEGLKVVDLGLKNRPDSAALHYERGMFLSMLDDHDTARADFDSAMSLAPQSEVAYLAATQKAMFSGNIAEAVRVSREGVAKGYEHYMLLALLGEALVRTGAVPGTREFEEANAVLSRAIEKRPTYSSPQITLGKLLLMEDRAAQAIRYLESARRLEPNNPAIYASLVAAYRKHGEPQKAQEAIEVLAALNAQEKANISFATGESKTGYAGTKRTEANDTAAPK